MNDEDKQREAALRGEKARAILESPLWQECWALYESRILEAFKETTTEDTARMQKLRMLLHAGLAARKHIEAVFEDGKFAAADLEMKAKNPVRSLLDKITTPLKRGVNY